MDQEKPSVVYKYHPINQYFFDLLGNSKLWFSHQNELNDPFDCKYAFTDEFFRSFMHRTATKMLGDIRNRAPHLNEISDESFLNMMSSVVHTHEWKNGFYNMLYDSLGWSVCCFTTDFMNDLMWAFYANCGKGVCIEFGIAQEPFFEKIYQVKYEDKFPEINSIDDMGPALLVKRMSWQHEREWRLLTNVKGAHAFNKKCIKKIIFGYNVEKKKIDEIRQFMVENGYTEVQFQQVNMRINGTPLRPLPEGLFPRFKEQV